MSSHDSNARLAELIRAGLQRADQLGRTRVPLKLFPAEDQEGLLTLLHAYLWDTAAPYDDEWHHSPGNIMTPVGRAAGDRQQDPTPPHPTAHRPGQAPHRAGPGIPGAPAIGARASA